MSDKYEARDKTDHTKPEAVWSQGIGGEDLRVHKPRLSHQGKSDEKIPNRQRKSLDRKRKAKLDGLFFR